MEPLTIFGLVCNVFQVISFAHEVYDVSKRINEDGSPDVSSLGNASRLESLSQKLDSSIKDFNKPLTSEQHELQKTAQKCLEVSRKLQKDLDVGTFCRSLCNLKYRSHPSFYNY